MSEIILNYKLHPPPLGLLRSVNVRIHPTTDHPLREHFTPSQVVIYKLFTSQYYYI